MVKGRIASTGTRRKAFGLPADQQLQKGFSALAADGPGALLCLVNHPTLMLTTGIWF